MANRVLKAVQSECVAGKKTIDICKLGDELIVKETSAVYNKQKEPIKKGRVPRNTPQLTKQTVTVGSS